MLVIAGRRRRTVSVSNRSAMYLREGGREGGRVRPAVSNPCGTTLLRNVSFSSPSCFSCSMKSYVRPSHFRVRLAPPGVLARRVGPPLQCCEGLYLEAQHLRVGHRTLESAPRCVPRSLYRVTFQPPSTAPPPPGWRADTGERYSLGYRKLRMGWFSQSQDDK